ncbi:polysaccharide deacetylase family protein [Bradyrhizobium sp. ARR65]|uniref:polysaccharide deacetylase family protein n=1 Tax=Bradyrhizobium sp. ARR65 TaxID=1040989 RepID=UPI0018DBF490|nr:polysaccharide deacetylase family protein [Bradyrhizobium sp. ARR65]
MVYYGARTLFRYSLRLTGRPSTQRLTILYYHGVSPKHRHSFARQMDALRRSAFVLPASYRGDLPSGKKCVAITFDDAFVSVAENALPELARRSFHSTIFVPVGWMGRTPGWAMKGEAAPELAEVVMAPEQLNALDTSLVALASHSVSHPLMTRLDSKRARRELEESRARLAELSGRKIVDFSFPYGDHDASIVAMCRAAGYETAYSIMAQEVDTTGLEILRGRTKVEPSDGPMEFFLKFDGAYEWTACTVRLRKLLRSIFGKWAPSIRIQHR